MGFEIADTFIKSLEKLSNEEKKSTKIKAFNLQMNPANPGMKIHRIHGYFWSMRVNDDIRIIIHKADDNIMVCYVDHHDQAYRWAKRCRIDKNLSTGVTQIIETRKKIIEKNIYQPIEGEENVFPNTLPGKKLFMNISNKVLQNYGVPDEYLDAIRNATEDEFLEIATDLDLNNKNADALLDLVTPSGNYKIENDEKIYTAERINNIEELERTIKWMDENELERCLRSIGKACFVKYYEYFSNMDWTNSYLVELLMKENAYTKNGSRTRVCQARRIINADMAHDAFDNILKSQRLKRSIHKKAEEFLNKLI